MNQFLAPSSFLDVAVDDEGRAAWESWNDFGTFVNRLVQGNRLWDKRNASLTGFLPDGRVLALPSPGLPTPTTMAGALERKLCGLFRLGAFEEVRPTN